MCHKDKAGGAGSTARTTRMHTNSPKHARQESGIHVESARIQGSVTASKGDCDGAPAGVRGDADHRAKLSGADGHWVAEIKRLQGDNQVHKPQWCSVGSHWMWHIHPYCRPPYHLDPFKHQMRLTSRKAKRHAAHE